MSHDIILEARSVSKHFGGLRVVNDVNLQVRKGDRLAIIGPSGSGKSTMCRMFAGLELPDRGDIFVASQKFADGKLGQITAEGRKVRRRLGFVPQQYTLLPHLTLAANVALGPRRVLKLPQSQVQDIVAEVLGKVGLAGKFGSYPAQLSGGQRQRGAIARELAMQREVLIFDEPTSALDPELSAEVSDVMLQLARDGLTMVVVTHEMDLTKRFASRIATMKDGALVQVVENVASA